MSSAFIGLGSNMGDRIGYLNQAIYYLSQHEKINICRESSFYETAPVGYIDQNRFVNKVIEINTTLLPYELLDVCQGIEKKLKRKRDIRWGPRTIDLDILLYDQEVSNDDRLILPHPRMIERAFVMIPLQEIAPDLKIQGRKIKTIIDEIIPSAQIKDIKKLQLSQ